MALFERKSVITGKIETVYGTDPVPAAATDAVLVENLSIVPLKQDLVERNSIQPYFGNRQQIESKAAVEITFDVEIAGSGTPGTAPGYAPLLRMCAAAETLVAVTSAAYNPISEAIESGTLYFYADGVLHKALGCRGSVSAKITAGQIPIYSFSFTGLYSPVTDASLVSPTLSAFQTPLVANSTNTPTLSIHGFTTAVLNEFTLDLGNQVVHRNLIGSESVVITDRNVTGKVVIEAVTVGTKDFFAAAKASTLAVFTIIHGTAAGNIMTVSGPKVQLSNPSYSDQDGIRMLNLDMIFTPTTAGNDEIVITNT